MSYRQPQPVLSASSEAYSLASRRLSALSANLAPNDSYHDEKAKLASPSVIPGPNQTGAEGGEYERKAEDASRSIEGGEQEAHINPRPFFTLITDEESGDYFHPYVHYLFEDDDPELLTAASVQVLDETTSGRSLTADAQKAITPATDISIASTHSRYQDGTEDRYIVVSLGTDLHSVKAVYSMSGDWQVLDASISTAPTWDNETTQDGGEEIGSMLNIIGTAVAGGYTTANEPEGAVEAEGLQMLQDAISAHGDDVLAAIQNVAENLQKTMAIILNTGETVET